MDSRWLLLGFGLLAVAVAIGAIDQGKTAVAAIAIVHAVLGLGGYWWNATREEPIETRFSRP